jgi:hypothetical protein
MSILNWTTSQTGLAGVVPKTIYINTNDTTGAVTAAGYLTAAHAEGMDLNSTDMALVSTTTGSQWYQVSITGSVPTRSYSLVAPISGGNVIAGSSGNAGYLATYPATAATGYLKVQGVSNSADYITTISNAAMGQASVVSIPDPASATGRFLVAATATPFVSGNIPVASGTGGLMVDSGISSNSTTASALQSLTATVTLNATAVNAAYATPAALLAAPAAGTMYAVSAVYLYTNFGSAAFANGGVGVVQYGATVHGAGTNALSGTIAAANITAGASQVILTTGSTTALTGVTATGLFFSNQTAAFITGTGCTLTFIIKYNVITATV